MANAANAAFVAAHVDGAEADPGPCERWENANAAQAWSETAADLTLGQRWLQLDMPAGTGR